MDNSTTNQNNPAIEDAEIVTSDETPSSQENAEKGGSENAALTLLKVEEYVKQYLSDIAQLQARYKEQKSMFDDTFANDATYKELNEKAKDAARLKNAARQQILKQPAVTELDHKLKEMKEELASQKEALSDYLREYVQLSGSNQFTSDDGEVLEIVKVHKLVRKSKYRP